MFIFIAKLINIIDKKSKTAKNKCDNPEMFEEVTAVLAIITLIVLPIVIIVSVVFLSAFAFTCE